MHGWIFLTYEIWFLKLLKFPVEDKRS